MLLECQGLRIDRGDATLLEEFELKLEAHSVGLVGAVDGLFEVMSARAAAVSGSFRIDGIDARDSVASGRVGLVLSGQQRSPRWTVLDLLKKSAILAGIDPVSVPARAHSALERVGLGSLGVRRLGMLSRVELTAVEIAAALQTDPRVLALRGPFRGLDLVASDWLWQVLDRAGKGRELLVSFDAVSMVAKLERFEQLVLVRGQRLVAVGAPTDLLVPSAFLVSVTRGGQRLASLLEESGFGVHASELSDDVPLSLIVQGDQAPLARSLARIATEHQIPVIELVPLGVAPPVSGLGGGERAM